MDNDSVRRRHPTPASPIVSRRPAAMPVTPRSGAATAPRQMRFAEDEDDWGHFAFEDGDAPPSSLENYRWN